MIIDSNFCSCIMKEEEIFSWIKDWIKEEKDPLTLGVLATVDENGVPFTRTIAIKEVNKEGLLFFTQKKSKKVNQIHQQPHVSVTIVLLEKKRQITMRGFIKSLSEEENDHYWNQYARQSQLRFLVYGPVSGEKIKNNCGLDNRLKELEEEYKGITPKKPDAYVGYRIIPAAIELYQLNSDRLSDSFVATIQDDNWQLDRVVP